ncbi:MAG: NAD(P)/FAD-dependent oxidoreductase [Pigmentiphaga sp.]
MSATNHFDAVILGAGAAGMMCAAVAGQRGLRVALIDHATRLAEKIRISGGGRCNFTNLGAGGAHGFLSANPAFCRSALARYTPHDFLGLLARHRISWHEKHRGQLFCDDSSEAVIRMLQRECDGGGVTWHMGCEVKAVRAAEPRAGARFELDTSAGRLSAAHLVVATGGMAIPQLGATDFALGLARQFGLKVIEPRPALVPLTFDAEAWAAFTPLAGAALEVDIATGKGRRAGHFREDLLFTHRGLSGPAVLQISSYWEPGQAILVDLLPDQNDWAEALCAGKSGNRQHLDRVLAQYLPRRLAEQWLEHVWQPGGGQRRLADVADRDLRRLAEGLGQWRLVPSGTAGYRKAEVMRGGVDTRELDQHSMQARKQPGLYFVGEAVDVTGWLGGYNFQWAWASAVACGRAL